MQFEQTKYSHLAQEDSTDTNRYNSSFKGVILATTKKWGKQ